MKAATGKKLAGWFVRIKVMKILVLSNSNLHENQGSGYIILNFVRGLRDRGHHVDLFGPESYWFRGWIRGRRYWKVLGMLILGLRQLRRETYDVVECYGGESWLLMWLISKWPWRRWKLVHHSNGIESNVQAHLVPARRKGILPTLPGYQLNLSSIYDVGVRAADYVVTLSAYDRQCALHRKLRQPESVKSIEPALPKEFLRVPLNGSRRLVVGYCGNWIPIKNIDTIAQDVPLFLSENPDWKFEAVGPGTDAIKEHPSFDQVRSQVNCLGKVPRAALRDWYASISVLILPSIYESFGLVAAEAMASGCAVIATRTTGFAGSLVHGKEVFLMDSEGSPSLYAALTNLSLDEEQRKRIATGGYHRVQQLDWKRAIDDIEAVYKHLLAADTVDYKIEVETTRLSSS